MARVEISSMPWGTLWDRHGEGQNGTTATLKNLDGTNATTWSAITGGTSSTASLTADASGNLPRFVEGGQYTLDVPALSITGRRVEAVSGSVESDSLQTSTTPTNTIAIQAVTDPSGTHGTGAVFGNAASFGFSGTGSPLGIFGPFGVHHKFGDYTGLTNADILKTTQGFFANTEYWGRTVDDSAEGGNCGIYMKNTGTPYTQAKSVTAFETDVQIEGNVTVTADALAHGSRLTILTGGTAAQVIGQKADLWSANNKGASYGTATSWKAFYDDLYNPAGSTFGASESVHGYNAVTSEQSLNIARSGYGGSVTMAAHGTAYNGSLAFLQVPSPSTTTAIADGAFTNGSRLMTTATAVDASWIGRVITNANVPTGTQVLSFYGTGPYTVVMNAAATGTASSQAVTILEPDLTALRINMAAGQTTGNAIDVRDSGSNQRFVVSRAGTVILKGVAVAAQTGGGVNTASIDGGTGALTAGTTAGTGAREWSGSGAPTTPGGSLTYNLGDKYWRTDTPGTANQLLYVVTVAGTSPTWTGKL